MCWNDADAVRAQWFQVTDQIRPEVPKLAVSLDEPEEGVLAYMIFPKSDWAKLHSTSPTARLHGEFTRRTEVVSIFPGEAAITRPIGAVLLKQNDE